MSLGEGSFVHDLLRRNLVIPDWISRDVLRRERPVLFNELAKAKADLVPPSAQLRP
jgi:hypothetical protein